MVIYTCNNCQKEFSLKGDYEKHLARKNPCKKYEPKEEETNYDLIIKRLEQLEKEAEYQKTKNKLLETKNKELERELNDQKCKIDNMAKTPNVTNVINNSIHDSVITNNSTNTTNVIISLSAFDDENLDFITDKEARKILNATTKPLLNVIETVHFNKDKPEYHNVYISNWRDRSNISIYDGTDWVMEDKADVLESLVRMGRDYIQEKYDELDENNDKDRIIINKLDKFFEKINANENIFNKNIQLMLYNNRKMVEDTKKMTASKQEEVKTKPKSIGMKNIKIHSTKTKQ